MATLTPFQQAVYGYTRKSFEDSRNIMVDYPLGGEKKDVSIKKSFNQKLMSAIKCLENNCNAVHGFQSKVSERENLEHAKTMLPNVFDSAFLLPLLNDLPVHPAVSCSIINMLLDNRSVDGFWNFFHKDYRGILPNDLDTTCTALEALVSVGAYTEDNGRYIALKILEMATIYDDGLVDSYFPDTTDSQVLQLRENKRRVDIGTTCNLLRVMGVFKLDNVPELTPSFKLVESAVDAILNEDTSNQIFKDHARYYSNWDVICYLISRIILVSTKGSSLFREKLRKIICAKLRCDNKSTYMACRIMTALNVKLENLTPLLDEAIALLDEQSNDDNAFPAHCFYLGTSMYYFGSTVTSKGLAVAAMGMLQKEFRNLNEIVLNENK